MPDTREKCARRTRVCRPLFLAAFVYLGPGLATAAAQTILVTNAPPESTIELVLNSSAIGTTTVDASGNARIPMNLTTAAGKTETDVSIFVDACEKLHRLVLVERAMQPPPVGENCDRRQVVGLFMMRRVSTLVFDVAGANPTVLLRQGSFSLTPRRTWTSSPTGLVVFGGGGLAMFRDTVAIACGNVSGCNGEDRGGGYAAGVEYWFSRYVAAEGSYVKPAELTIDASGDTFRFNSYFDAHIVTVAGKVGVPAGPVRFYGKVGTNYHRATFGTTQTSDDVTVTIGDTTETIEGGTQTFSIETGGWGWTFGGGIEAWVTPRIGFYGEVGRSLLKGNARDDADGRTDEGVTAVVLGGRLRIGR